MPQNTFLSTDDSKPDDSKSVLRRELRLKRKGLPDPLRATFDEAIRQHLSQLVQSRKARSIACYWSFNGEPDITPLCYQLMDQGLELALPVTSEKDDQLMEFHTWHADTRLGKNKYGIFEPQQSAAVPVDRFDMLFMPLVAYDRLGTRLGLGSGYYDRHLELLRHLPAPLRVGIAYSLQEIETMARNSWDIPLHGVVNERGWFTFVAT